MFIHIYISINNIWCYFVGFTTLHKWCHGVFILLWSFFFHVVLLLPRIAMNDWTVYLSSNRLFPVFAIRHSFAVNILPPNSLCSCARVFRVYASKWNDWVWLCASPTLKYVAQMPSQVVVTSDIPNSNVSSPASSSVLKSFLPVWYMASFFLF